MAAVSARRRVQYVYVTAADAVARSETFVEEMFGDPCQRHSVNVTMRTPGSNIELAQGHRGHLG
jgi:uncharacterized protein YcgL (UPF0745 family)